MATRDHGRMSRSRLYVTVVCCELASHDVFMLFNKRVRARKLELFQTKTKCTRLPHDNMPRPARSRVS